MDLFFTVLSDLFTFHNILLTFGGAFFGKAGSFENGYDFDAVVLDDSRLKSPRPLDIRSRLERMIYLADEREIRAKFVKGQEISL